jgi:predicted Ser/Thr protein kinase
VLHVGQVLEGKYRIEKMLDKGGMGQVFQVQHLTLGKPFALKILAQLSTYPREQDEFRRQFETEARILAGLDHPGLTRVIDLFHDEKTSYLVMELVEGVTLTRMLADSVSPLSQEAVSRLADQALDVLEYLHQCNPPIIVRDIKPDNLMITRDGRLKLIDFGLAKRLIVGEDTDSIVRGMGTDCYAPMEQYGEGVTDQRSDLYSLGATLYFALTGSPPPPVWKRASLKEPLPSPAEKNPTVSKEFWKGLQAMLEVDMKPRPTDVAQARQLLCLTPIPSQTASKTRTLIVSHGIDYRLASAQAYYPFQPGDWILKVMQAATAAQAREVRVTQNRATCKIVLGIPAHGLPDAGAVLDALVGEREPDLPWLYELACGLKMVGEFRDFRLTLDNWQRAWQVHSRAGKLEALPVESEGQAGLFLEVDYVGKAMDKVRQAADEVVGLARRTRLCPFPLYVDDRRMNWERPLQRPLLTDKVKEVYLASISMPADGQVQYQRKDQLPGLGEEDALTSFSPRDGRPQECYLDLRAYLEPTLGAASVLTGFCFLRQPLHLLWYRHGVLCAHQEIQGWHSLEIMAHMDGTHLPAGPSGLSVEPVELMFPNKLKPLTSLEKVLPIITAELEGLRAAKPDPGSSVGKAAVGAVATPLLVLLFGAAAGPIVMKSALAAGILQKAAAVGGVAGLLHHDREEALLRKACLKAVQAYNPRGE